MKNVFNNVKDAVRNNANKILLGTLLIGTIATTTSCSRYTTPERAANGAKCGQHL